MTNQHPITPPPEMVEEWVSMLEYHPDEKVLSEVAQWGADQELQSCCEWLVRNYNYPEAGNPLRTARRPKPPSLKEQALSLIPEVCGLPMMRTYSPDELLILRRALEALPND